MSFHRYVYCVKFYIFIAIRLDWIQEGFCNHNSDDYVQFPGYKTPLNKISGFYTIQENSGVATRSCP